MQFNQTPAWGSQSTCVISRTGDLLSKTWLNVTLPALNPPQTKQAFIARKAATTHPQLVADPQLFDNDLELQKEFIERNQGSFPRARYCDCVGFALIDKVDLVIGGTLIDSHPGHYLQVWDELTQTPEKKQIAHLVGRSGSEAELEELAQHKQHLYIPLQFFFCRHLMCSLPLIALQYHQVEIKVTFKHLKEVVAFPGYAYPAGSTSLANASQKSAVQLAMESQTADFADINEALSPGTTLSKREMPKEREYQIEDAKLMCNLVYLEEEERKTFAGSTHEYLVDLLQYQGPHPATGENTTYHAYFNHPTSELIWTFVPKVSIEEGEPFNYSALQSAYNAAGDTLVQARLQFNGYDRFQNMPAEYFREIVPAQYHTSVPTRPIYVYSFALEPEDFRPSGSVNLSRIDNVKLITQHVKFDPEIVPAPGTEFDPTTGAATNANTSAATKAALGSGKGVAVHPQGQSGKGLFLHQADGFASDIRPGAELRVYARSKNVLRIKSGMAGLAYAN